MTLYNLHPGKILHKSALLFLFLLGISGCNATHSKFLSEHWVAKTSTFRVVSTSTQTSRLQVIITYDGLLSSHSALRLVSGDGKVTFWDPAGAYGLMGYITDQQGKRIKPYGKRVRDIITTHIPDIPTYMKFRWLVGDSSVEIFEWDLPGQQTEELGEILQKETDESHPLGEFHTETAPAFCSIALSDFLKRFATPTIQLAKTYLWPHSLGEALLEQSPSRVRLFLRGQEEMVYIPPLP